MNEEIIAVNINSIPSDYEPILNYYNERRPEGSPVLEELDRMEGGFKIRLPKHGYGIEPDCKIAQLRWFVDT